MLKAMHTTSQNSNARCVGVGGVGGGSGGVDIYILCTRSTYSSIYASDQYDSYLSGAIAGIHYTPYHMYLLL